LKNRYPEREKAEGKPFRLLFYFLEKAHILCYAHFQQGGSWEEPSESNIVGDRSARSGDAMMSPSASSFMKVARSGRVVYIRIEGMGNMNNSATFKSFGDIMIEEGYRRFILDLNACSGLDSTFMGCMLGLAVALKERTGKYGVLVINPDEHCWNQIAGIGLHKILRVRRKTIVQPELELHPVKELRCSPIERIKLMLKAHEALIKIDKKNEEKFGPFLKALSRELKTKPPTGQGD
jgi:hypothetical protein